MRTALVALLICLTATTAQAAKCRSGTKITNEYDRCPPGYTDITGQQHGETWGIKPCTEPMSADTTVCRLPTPPNRQKDAPAGIEKTKKSGL